MESKDVLLAKIDDIVRRVDGYGCLSTRFLTHKEVRDVSAYLSYTHPDVNYRVCGGYPDAERCMIVFTADYMSDTDVNNLDVYKVIRIKGSGYADNLHKDYLGALLGLGVSRDTLGDIIVQDKDAYVFVLPDVADFLTSNEAPLTYVGRDKVKIFIESNDVCVNYRRSFVASDYWCTSLRLDCVVSAVCKISRAKAVNAIAAEEVFLNYDCVTQNDVKVNDADVLSVRRYGKFVINLRGVTSSKGKFGICAKKYI